MKKLSPMAYRVSMSFSAAVMIEKGKKGVKGCQ
jgi:hypothetical protein